MPLALSIMYEVRATPDRGVSLGVHEDDDEQCR